MNFLYLLIRGSDSEDMTVLLSEEDAIEESIKYPDARVEIFSVNNEGTAYEPTNNYYKCGKLMTYS